MADDRKAMEILQANVEALAGTERNERFGMAGLPAVLSRCIRAWSQSEMGEFPAAIAEAGEALEIAEASGHVFSILTASFVIAVVRLARGDLAEAIRVLEQGLALSRADRMRIWFPAFAILLASSLALQVRAATAVPIAQPALAVPPDPTTPTPLATDGSRGV